MTDSDTTLLEEFSDVLRIRRARRITFFSVVFAILLVGLIAFGFLLIKTVTLNISPNRALLENTISGTDGFSIALGRNVHFFGAVEVEVRADGFFPRTITLDRNTQSPVFVELRPQPGNITFELNFLVDEPQTGYSLTVNGGKVFAPLPETIELMAGTYDLRLQGPQEYDSTQSVEVLGFGNEQVVSFSAMPRGSFSVSVEPSSANIKLNGTFVGNAHVRQTVVATSHVLEFEAEGYISERLPFSVSASQHVNLGTVTLEGAPGVVTIVTEPSAASVLIDGQFIGSTPLEKDFYEPTIEVELRIPNYHSKTVTIPVRPGDTVTQTYTLLPVRFEVEVASQPPAEISLNAEQVASTPQTISVTAGDVLEVSKDGYASQTITIASAERQARQINVTLIDQEQHLYNQAPLFVDTQGTIRLKKFPAAEFQVNVPRYLMEDDLQRTRAFEISRPFYFGVHEISRKEYAKFDSSIKTTTEDEDLPITDIAWIDAVKYCNWLSEQEGIEPAYILESGARVSINLKSKGYRLPTEAEWELVTYFDFETETVVGPFMWGEGTKPPTGVGNLAGYETRSALQSFITNYGDQHKDLAPIGSYRRNFNGIHDLVGNAAEWVYDYSGGKYEGWDQFSTDPMGPNGGIDHIVKGASFKTIKLHETAINFRRTAGYKDATVGFRIARWVL